MGDKTGIERTEATWNPIVGCSVCSPGCANCYAMKQAARIQKMTPNSHYIGTTQDSKAGAVWTGEVKLAPDHIITLPLRWKRPRMIFVNSMGDLFHESVPDEWIDDAFAVMALCPHHIFQVLTKRAERMAHYFNGPYQNGDGVMARIADATFNFVPQGKLPDGFPGKEYPIGPSIGGDANHPEFGWRRFLNIGPLPNVWLGVSAEDQKRYDERKEHLRATTAAVRFFSMEPLLGPIYADYLADWVIVGGESGQCAREMKPEWVRSLRDQCDIADIPFFMKQWGGVNKRVAGCLLDGREHKEMPKERAHA